MEAEESIMMDVEEPAEPEEPEQSTTPSKAKVDELENLD